LKQALVIALTLVPALAAADVNPKFAKLRDAAEPLGGLGQFIDSYVGDCLSAALGGSECQKNAAACSQNTIASGMSAASARETAATITAP
jgi:hypothetical protein